MKPIDLYILRHGVAEELASAPSKKDSDRRLTDDGKKKIHRSVKGLKKSGVDFDLILSSPFVRAKETAEAVADILKREKQLKFSSSLATGGNPHHLIDELKKKHSKKKSILLVGHEPYLSRLISLLISGDTRIPITMKKGGLCKLTVTQLQYGRCASLEWLLTPNQIHSLK